MNKRKIVVISIVTVIVIIIVIGLALAWNHFNDYSTTLKANWGFSFSFCNRLVGCGCFGGKS